MSVDFAHSERSSVGVEWEFVLVDPATKAPVALAAQLIAAVKQTGWLEGTEPLVDPRPTVVCAKGGAQVKPELLGNCIELASMARRTVAQTADDLACGLEQLMVRASQLGVELMAAGTHPFAHAQDQAVVDTPRYRRLIDKTQWWGRQQMIYGLHTHVGIEDQAKVPPIIKALARHLPHLLALTAASPWWGGIDTGYASNRAMIFQQLPTAGLPVQFDTWAEWEAYTADLLAASVIDQVSEIRWDIRPAPGFGTVESRIGDAVPTLLEIRAISALTQCLVEEASSELDRGEAPASLPDWLVRENKFRAARYGLEATVIVDRAGGQRPLRQDLAELLTRLEPVAAALDCLDDLALVQVILDQGASYQRQRAVAEAAGGDLTAVVAALTAELAAGRPL